MNRLAWCVLFGSLALAWAIAYHAPPPDFGPPSDHIARTYDVSDLLDLPPDPDDPPPLAGQPSAYGSRSRQTPAAGPPPPAPVPLEQQRLNELVDEVQRTVDPAAWGAGGKYITTFGHRLVVTQTRQNHDAIRSLLDDLRAFPPRQVRVEALLARLTPAQFDALSPPPAPAGPPVRTLDIAALERTPAAIAFRGQATCISGRRARVAAGHARTAIVGVEAAVFNDATALEPQARQLLDGTTVDVVPSLSPDGATVLLDVRAELTRFDPNPGPPIAIPAPNSTSAGSLHIDRLTLGIQALQASARGPAGAGIFLGETADPDRPPAEQLEHRLYLIVRATEWKDLKRPAKP